MTRGMHTPGPWSIGATKRHKDHESTPIYGEGIEVASSPAFTVDEREMVRANALLISAAPDLMAALEAILEWADPYALPDSDRNARDVEAGVAAIAKARGERLNPW